MRLDLTPAVTRALELATTTTAEAGARTPDALHLLLALLEEDEGRAAELLRTQTVSVAEVRLVLSRFHATEPLPACEGLIHEARRLAGGGADAVAGDHVLMAILHAAPTLRLALEHLPSFDWQRLQDQLTPAADERLTLDEPLELAEPTEQIDIARILDANANRAREGLRVIEEYARFVLDDGCLTRELKAFRHRLAKLLQQLPWQTWIAARDTERDVGSRLRLASAYARTSIRDVVQANCKRLQEALRAIEEYLKVTSPWLARQLEALRYQSYTIEKAILSRDHAAERLAEARLYLLVTGSLCAASLEWTIKEAIAGGVQIVQLREKSLPDRALTERARKVKQWTQSAGALFIMNDRPDIARLVEADGVHVGQEELTVKDVRRIVGPNVLIGVSTHDLSQVTQALRDGASYIGVGPTFPSATKNFAAFPGLDFIRQVASATTLPVFAIGGVTPDNVAEVRAAGLSRVAVSQAICQADDPRAVAQRLRHVLDGQ